MKHNIHGRKRREKRERERERERGFDFGGWVRWEKPGREKGRELQGQRAMEDGAIPRASPPFNRGH